MAAIYTAITEQQIIYSTIPAGFEEYGQRMYVTDSVLAQKLGTCLDMALLYASCLGSYRSECTHYHRSRTRFAGAIAPELFRILPLTMFPY